MNSPPPPPVLSVCGVDPCARSGLHADVRAFTAMGVEGRYVISTVTAQNATQFLASYEVPVAIIEQQLEAIWRERTPLAAKTGLLGNAETVALIAAFVRKKHLPTVVDPVLRSTTGRFFASESYIQTYLEHLIPQACLITPNLHEASLLCGFSVEDRPSIERAGEHLSSLGPSVLITGGHRRDRPTDVLFHQQKMYHFYAERVHPAPSRGLGCTLSALITALLARKRTIPEACEIAKAYLTAAMRIPAPFPGEPRCYHPFEATLLSNREPNWAYTAISKKEEMR